MMAHHLYNTLHPDSNRGPTPPPAHWSHLSNTSPPKPSLATLASSNHSYSKIVTRKHFPVRNRYNPEKSPIKNLDADLNRLLGKVIDLGTQMANKNASFKPQKITSPRVSKTMRLSSPCQTKQLKPKEQQTNRSTHTTRPVVQIRTSPRSRFRPNPSYECLNIGQFALGRLLGQGKFGQVFEVIHKRTGTIYAVKKVFKSIVQQHKIEGQLLNEVSILSQLNHPNIIKLYTCFTDPYHVFMVTEHVPAKTLSKFFRSEESAVSRIIHQIIKALQYIHSKYVMHRDIKPENILYCDGIVKICDFGWATTFKNRKSTTYCGTLDYVSPEVLEGRHYNNSVDLWSLGILVYELLSGQTPFKEDSKQRQMQNIKHCNRRQIQYPSCVSGLAQDFISKLLIKEASLRMPLAQAQRHPFITAYQTQFRVLKDIAQLI